MISLIGLLINGSLIGAAVFVVGWISVTALKVGGPERFERTWRRVMQLIIGSVLVMAAGCLVFWLASIFTGPEWPVRSGQPAAAPSLAVEPAPRTATEQPE